MAYQKIDIRHQVFRVPSHWKSLLEKDGVDELIWKRVDENES
jgi:hypothetical protein